MTDTRTLAEHHTEEETTMSYVITNVTAAQPIRRYCAPQWLIEPQHDAADTEELVAINESIEYAPIEVLDQTIEGWGDYNAIIRTTDGYGEERDYLATIATYTEGE